MADKKIKDPSANKEAKNGALKRGLLIALVAVCLFIFLFSGYKLANSVRSYRESREAYDSLSGKVTATAAPSSLPDPEVSADPDVIEYPPKEVDFDKLNDINKDIIGWLYSENTVIDYPVLIGEDNDDYIYTLYDGTYNAGGSLFANCLNQKDFSSRNTIIYGHNMLDGSMFRSLTSYKDSKYYNEHKTLYLMTPDQDYKLVVFSAYITDYDSDAYTITFNDDNAFRSYLDKCSGNSLVETGVSVDVKDNIVTLSTCTYEYNDARFVVQCKLVPIGDKGLGNDK